MEGKKYLEQFSRIIVWLTGALRLAGGTNCWYPSSPLEQDYGYSMRNSLAQSVLNPRAGLDYSPTAGLAAKAGVNALERYDKSFKGEDRKPSEMKVISPY